MSEIKDIDAVIIVDDHSTDGTYEIMLSEKESLHSPIQLVQLEKNYGQLIAYQAGNSLTKTNIVIHCDDDVLLTREDLRSYIDSYVRSGHTLLYGLAPGKSDQPRGRSTFLWLVRTFVFYRLKDKEFSSLCIYDKRAIQKIFSRAWGFRGNLFTPWILHPHELGHVTLTGGSRILPHPSRYSMRGYIQHQKFLLLMLTRLLSLTLLTLWIIGMISGVVLTNDRTIFILTFLVSAFMLSAAFLRIKSELKHEIARKS
jgi:glycosyltransferase involved in cell wall biosynthesis